MHTIATYPTHLPKPHNIHGVTTSTKSPVIRGLLIIEVIHSLLRQANSARVNMLDARAILWHYKNCRYVTYSEVTFATVTLLVVAKKRREAGDVCMRPCDSDCAPWR
jgi:hypothetical protein